MKHLIPALALLAATAMPALAAENDPLGDNLQAQWLSAQTAQENVRRALAALLQERATLQQQIATLQQQCGDRCTATQPQPKADSPPVPKP
jgi:cell division protein FtsB